MGRSPCCSKVGLHRGPWTSREDALLTSYIDKNGEGNWRSLPKKAGLLRCGKSCRLRWMNYLRPDIKRGNIGPDEEDLIIRLHRLLGNRWSLIAGRLPGRTDNEIKNYWNSHLSKKLRRQGVDVREAVPRSRQSKSNQQTKRQSSNASNNDCKIYAPKPTRLMARVLTGKTCEEEKPSSEHGESSTEIIKHEEELSVNDWSDVGELEVAETSHGFHDSGFQSSYHLGFSDHIFPFQQEAVMLDKLYHEYSQLLQTEVDSDLFSHHFLMT